VSNEFNTPRHASWLLEILHCGGRRRGGKAWRTLGAGVGDFGSGEVQPQKKKQLQNVVNSKKMVMCCDGSRVRGEGNHSPEGCAPQKGSGARPAPTVGDHPGSHPLTPGFPSCGQPAPPSARGRRGGGGWKGCQLNREKSLIKTRRSSNCRKCDSMAVQKTDSLK